MDMTREVSISDNSSDTNDTDIICDEDSNEDSKCRFSRKVASERVESDCEKDASKKASVKNKTFTIDGILGLDASKMKRSDSDSSDVTSQTIPKSSSEFTYPFRPVAISPASVCGTCKYFQIMLGEQPGVVGNAKYSKINYNKCNNSLVTKV